MTSKEITTMISDGNFPESFTTEDKKQIKRLYNSGYIQQAHKMVLDLIAESNKPKKTLL